MLVLSCQIVSAQPLEFFDGGNADGYDRFDAAGGVAWPFIHNAEGATNVTTNSAWLNGFLCSTGDAPTTVYVYWGDNDGATNQGDWDSQIDFGARAIGGLTTNITDLAPNTWYYYRFYATNEDAGVWASPSETFMTYGPPTVDNGIGACPVGQKSAALNCRLINCVSASIYIYWGTDPNNWSHTNSLGEFSEGGFSVSVTNLTPGTDYYYRCYATNAYGEDWADSATDFTTLEEFLFFIGGDADGYDEFSTNTVTKTGVSGTVFNFR